MNNLNVVGRLTKDAELSYIKGSGVPALKFFVAVERKYQKDKNKKKVDYIPCESIGKHAEILAQYMVKGSLVNLIGEIHFEPYEKNDQKLTFTKMYVENLRLLESRKPKDENGKTFTPCDEDIPF